MASRHGRWPAPDGAPPHHNTQHPATRANAHQNSELQVERRRWPSVRSKGGHGATNPILNLRVDLFFFPARVGIQTGAGFAPPPLPTELRPPPPDIALYGPRCFPTESPPREDSILSEK